MSSRSKIKTSAAIAAQGKHSVLVVRSNKHFYAQIISPLGIVLTGASTKTKEVAKEVGKASSKKTSANILGKHVAKQLKANKITDIAFNRSGLLYHGRVAAFVEGLRSQGVQV